MNKLLIKTFAKKVIEILIYGPGYKAPKYAYVSVTKTDNKSIYNDRFQK